MESIAQITKNYLIIIIKETTASLQEPNIATFAAGARRAAFCYYKSWLDILCTLRGYAPQVIDGTHFGQAIDYALGATHAWYKNFIEEMLQFGLDLNQGVPCPAVNNTYSEHGASVFLNAVINSDLMRALHSNYAEAPLPSAYSEGQADWYAYAMAVAVHKKRTLSFFIPRQQGILHVALSRLIQETEALSNFMGQLQQLLANGEALCEYMICKGVIELDFYEQIASLAQPRSPPMVAPEIVELIEIWCRYRRHPNQFRFFLLILCTIDVNLIMRYLETHRPFEGIDPATLGRMVPLMVKLFNQYPLIGQ